jgi:two-component system sensor histidine kinase ResE
VSSILILLSLFLNEKVEVAYLEDQESSLRNLSREIQENLNKMDHNCAFYLGNVIKTAKLFHTYTMILDRQGQMLSHTKTGNLAKFRWHDLLEKKEIEYVLTGKQLVKQRNDIFILVSPYYLHGKIQGAIILYQLQNQPSETDIKKWITYSAVLGMFVTTIFAFFLSTRITQPLIQMKNAAEKMAKGELSIRVPTNRRQKDEIGDLSATFNKMAKQLEDLINHASQEKEHLSSILRSMSDGVITFNHFGKVILTNPPADFFLSFWEPLLPSALLSLVRKVVEDNQEHVGDI